MSLVNNLVNTFILFLITTSVIFAQKINVKNQLAEPLSPTPSTDDLKSEESVASGYYYGYPFGYGYYPSYYSYYYPSYRRPYIGYGYRPYIGLKAYLPYGIPLYG